MNPRRTKLCSQGTCNELLACWHVGDKTEGNMNVVRFVLQSYGMWAYKAAIEIAPSPIDVWLDNRKKAKKKRLKKRSKRRDERAIRRIRSATGV